MSIILLLIKHLTDVYTNKYQDRISVKWIWV